jgi:hypothetical protein
LKKNHLRFKRRNSQPDTLRLRKLLRSNQRLFNEGRKKASNLYKIETTDPKFVLIARPDLRLWRPRNYQNVGAPISKDQLRQ